MFLRYAPLPLTVKSASASTTFRPSHHRAAPRAQPTLALLQQWGPDGAAPAPSRPEALAYVRSLTTSHYENFSVLSRLVPADLRDDFAAVYAFCRWSDDLGDETGADDAARQRSLELLAWWRGELTSCAAAAASGSPYPGRHPVFVVLADTMLRRLLDPQPFHDLISAFEQDQRITRYQTWDQLVGYCRLSADPVGRIVLALAGHRGDQPGDAERFAMSDATCTALQLTNFWQDVRRDLFERDRVYLPSDLTGLDASTLRTWAERSDDPEARVAFIRALRPLVERTRELFDRGRPLPGTLDRSIAPVVWLFGAGGRSVLRSVERAGCATLWKRPTLSKARKVSLVARASLGLWRAP